MRPAPLFCTRISRTYPLLRAPPNLMQYSTAPVKSSAIRSACPLLTVSPIDETLASTSSYVAKLEAKSGHNKNTAIETLILFIFSQVSKLKWSSRGCGATYSSTIVRRKSIIYKYCSRSYTSIVLSYVCARNCHTISISSTISRGKSGIKFNSTFFWMLSWIQKIAMALGQRWVRVLWFQPIECPVHRCTRAHTHTRFLAESTIFLHFELRGENIPLIFRQIVSLNWGHTCMIREKQMTQIAVADFWVEFRRTEKCAHSLWNFISLQFPNDSSSQIISFVWANQIQKVISPISSMADSMKFRVTSLALLENRNPFQLMICCCVPLHASAGLEWENGCKYSVCFFRYVDSSAIEKRWGKMIILHRIHEPTACDRTFRHLGNSWDTHQAILAVSESGSARKMIERLCGCDRGGETLFSGQFRIQPFFGAVEAGRFGI